MNGKTTKQGYAAPIIAKQASAVAMTQGTPGWAGEAVGGFHISTEL
jgi:hypothetical protein